MLPFFQKPTDRLRLPLLPFLRLHDSSISSSSIFGTTSRRTIHFFNTSPLCSPVLCHRVIWITVFGWVIIEAHFQRSHNKIPVLYSSHTTIISYDIKEEEPQGCFSRPLHVIGMGIREFQMEENLKNEDIFSVTPSLFTFTTYYFLDGRDLDIGRLFERTDWLFISNYLLPTAVLFSISIVYAVWNVYIASGTR